MRSESLRMIYIRIAVLWVLKPYIVAWWNNLLSHWSWNSVLKLEVAGPSETLVTTNRHVMPKTRRPQSKVMDKWRVSQMHQEVYEQKNSCRVWGSHTGGYEECYFLGYNTRSLPSMGESMGVDKLFFHTYWFSLSFGRTNGKWFIVLHFRPLSCVIWNFGKTITLLQKVRDHWEDLYVGGWTILKWILER
jgi:hypothetical protein